jgi:hypothetical protein
MKSPVTGCGHASDDRSSAAARATAVSYPQIVLCARDPRPRLARPREGLPARIDTDPGITLAAVRRAAEAEQGGRALVLDGLPMSRSLVAEVEAARGAASTSRSICRSR